MQGVTAAREAGRIRIEALSEWLAICVAISLPWSTSATGILIALWLLAALPSLRTAVFKDEVVVWAAAGLPILLWLLAAVGMLWADVGWAERFGGFGAFHKLVVLPLLLHQFR
jgi:hypothetical protein